MPVLAEVWQGTTALPPVVEVPKEQTCILEGEKEKNDEHTACSFSENMNIG